MLLAPRPSSTVADLLRVVAAWLVVVVLLEGFAVVQSRAAGPLHRHRSVSMAPALASNQVHDPRQNQAAGQASGHAHDGAARHYHGAVSFVDDGLATAEELASLQDALDAATAALSMAFALLAVMAGIRFAQEAGRVWQAASSWAWLTAWCTPLRRPPKAA